MATKKTAAKTKPAGAPKPRQEPAPVSGGAWVDSLRARAEDGDKEAKATLARMKAKDEYAHLF